MSSGGVGRWSRLLGLGSLPGDQEEARSFLQKRIATFYGAMAIMGGALFVLSVVMMLRFMPWRLGVWLLQPTQLFHLLSTGFCTGAVLFVRQRKPSIRVLGSIDLIGSAVFVLSSTVMLLAMPAASRPEAQFLLILNMALVARAAIVPSTPLRTLFVGVIGAAALTTAAVWIHAHAPLPKVSLEEVRASADITQLPPPPAVIGVICFVWSSVTVALTVAVSHIIYGLQRKVAEAELLGQYRLDEKIGEGGMGMVYRASHALLRRPTAIKLLSPERSGADALARFEREVQTTATLTHPNTIAIYDYGRTPQGVFYYAMEYLDGIDLEALVRQHGAQSPARVVHILAQIAGALGEAHRAGLIHRDIKPANVILCERGGVADFVKVVDFGLVKHVAANGTPEATAKNVITGTPLYMSPESIITPDAIDSRSDLYALGAVAYYLLTGLPVFDGNTVVEVCAKHLHSDVVRPSERANLTLPPKLEALVMKCLEKRADKRPADAAAIAAMLSNLELDAWSPTDAADWWTKHRSVQMRRSEPVSVYGTTVSIDLNRRDVVAASETL